MHRHRRRGDKELMSNDIHHDESDERKISVGVFVSLRYTNFALISRVADCQSEF